MNILKRFKDKLQAFRVARHAGAFRELAEHKNNGESNTYVPYKERMRRKKRREMAKQSRRRNRG